MEGIDSLKKYLLTVHPVRKSGAQKREFRQWLLRDCLLYTSDAADE